LLVPDNLHHTLAMGWDAAASLDKEGGFDRSQWDASISTFKEHVVED